MGERPLVRRHFYRIPATEKLLLFTLRFTVLAWYLLRYKLRRVIPSEFKTPADAFRKYFPKYELPFVRRRLGLGGGPMDATAAIKVLTYFHTLTGVVGEITEMTPERAVRVETHCPAAALLSREFCRDVMSQPSFCAVARALNPNLMHTHPAFLSGGDDTCTLIFELKQGQ